MSIRIIKQGIADSMQDTGRYGYQHMGINPGGAMDTLAAQKANLLVGNDVNEAVIEIHFPASSFLFTRDAVIAMSGADFSAAVNDIPVPVNTTLIVAKNSLLQFKKINNGARIYLAAKGGFDIPKWLGSYSTNVVAGIGGFNGRFLKKDDEILLRQNDDLSELLTKNSFIELSLKADSANFYSSPDIIRIIKGNEWDWLTEGSKQKYINSPFIITPQSNRMGYRMHGEALQTITNRQLISTAVTNGTIQLLPNGQLIILMADHQTTGGYPRIGHVIAVDIPMLAQMHMNSAIRFRFIDIKEAEDLFINQQDYLLRLKNECNFYLDEFFR